MLDPVEDGIGQGGVSDGLVPVLEGKLTGEQSGASAGAVLQDLEKIAPFAVAQRSAAVVLENEQVVLLESVHELGIGPVAPGEGEVL